ncbi:hypothetical protein BpHYR1_038165 [Brachionus plicatilis]|uniref:Uncharacterized protein n=1 Tax=Brachionus plicatilis TaxID=10195 RepID=A0A3M7Q2E5_BRAPC|nr:hypothetical protein BpHYR1_038165 [Brachionus plicatilis]
MASSTKAPFRLSLKFLRCLHQKQLHQPFHLFDSKSQDQLFQCELVCSEHKYVAFKSQGITNVYQADTSVAGSAFYNCGNRSIFLWQMILIPPGFMYSHLTRMLQPDSLLIFSSLTKGVLPIAAVKLFKTASGRLE